MGKETGHLLFILICQIVTNFVWPLGFCFVVQELIELNDFCDE